MPEELTCDFPSLHEQIVVGARTVLHLQAHLDGLRSRAQERLSPFLESGRNYLTPSEDERTRQLLISYWHARNALLGTVAEFQKYASEHAQASQRQQDQVFLVGFTAALVLVDAGRFLRELCNPHPVIAAKLNEPEPYFEIPAGVYDTVQHNLTSPANAWRLYQAHRLFQRRVAEFATCAAEEPTLQSLFHLTSRLAERVQISKRRYARARLQVRADQVSRTVTTHTFGRGASWVIEMCSRAIGKIGVRPGHRPALPPAIRDALGPLLEPGDVIITRKEYAATNYFLPGFWPHAILYLGDGEALASLGLHEHANMRPRWQRLLEIDRDEPRRVLEAMADGVRLRSMLSAFSVDAVAVIRPQLTLAERAQAIGRGLFHEGKPYDFDFDFSRSHRLVCTEVVYRSYEGIGGLEFALTPRAGRLTLAAEDLLRMSLQRQGFELIAVHLPGAASLAIGAAATDALRSTLREREDD